MADPNRSLLVADIDNCDVAVALERVASVSLPYPTAVVNSGNGVHLYWRLNQPFVIDDAGPSIPVHIEPINSGESRKQARRYVLEGKDRVYLDQRHHLTKLSPKALQIQDVVAGIAEAIGATIQPISRDCCEYLVLTIARTNAMVASR